MGENKVVAEDVSAAAVKQFLLLYFLPINTYIFPSIKEEFFKINNA